MKKIRNIENEIFRNQLNNIAAEFPETGYEIKGYKRDDILTYKKLLITDIKAEQYDDILNHSLLLEEALAQFGENHSDQIAIKYSADKLNSLSSIPDILTMYENIINEIGLFNCQDYAAISAVLTLLDFQLLKERH